MCIVSMVVDGITNPYGPNKIPGLDEWLEKKTWPDTQRPFFPPPPAVDPELARMLRDVLERLDRIDKKLGLKDCKVEQEKKDRLMELLKEVVG
jgi:hypothetical protein